MAEQQPAETRSVTRRIVFIQLGIIAVMLALVIISNRDNQYRFDFWLAFLVGMLGSSMALLRKFRQHAKWEFEISKSFVDTMLPILYGAIFAGLTYFLFLSEIISGDGGKGLLTTNLFPRFAIEASSSRTMIQDFLHSQPASVPDLGKLMVWCFLSGYSERFAIGILEKLDKQAEK